MQTSSLRSILEIILGVCKCSRSRGNMSNLPVSDDTINVTPTYGMDLQNNAPSTWPLEQLELTLRNILVENEAEMENEQFDRLLRKVSEKLNEEYSYNLEQYDFCVICASDDYGEALEFQRDIETRLELSGYIVSEAVSLGKEQFQAYEEIVERSSKVIFYITENFTNDGFCCHLARNTFVAPGEVAKNKSIPIVDDLSTKMPDCMMLVEKLVKSNNFHIDSRLRNVFNDSVRQEKGRRLTEFKVNLDSKRLKLLESLLVTDNVIG